VELVYDPRRASRSNDHQTQSGRDVTTSIVSIRHLNEVGYKIDINTGVMKIRESRCLLLVKVKREANCLYLLHIKFAQLACFVVHGRVTRWRGVAMSASGTSIWRLFRNWLGRS
jgi:hypothetical protein